MTLHNDLIEQARHLATREPQKPRQASLRRAVSGAYYALFHALLHESTLLLFPDSPSELRHRACRAFVHSDMQRVCSKFAKGGGIPGLTTTQIEQELIDIATAFVELQQARHDADYNLSEVFDRVQVIAYVDRAAEAMVKLRAMKAAPNANVFLSALLVDSRWNK